MNCICLQQHKELGRPFDVNAAVVIISEASMTSVHIFQIYIRQINEIKTGKCIQQSFLIVSPICRKNGLVPPFTHV